MVSPTSTVTFLTDEPDRLVHTVVDRSACWIATTCPGGLPTPQSAEDERNVNLFVQQPAAMVKCVLHWQSTGEIDGALFQPASTSTSAASQQDDVTFHTFCLALNDMFKFQHHGRLYPNAQDADNTPMLQQHVYASGFGKPKPSQDDPNAAKGTTSLFDERIREALRVQWKLMKTTHDARAQRRAALEAELGGWRLPENIPAGDTGNSFMKASLTAVSLSKMGPYINDEPIEGEHNVSALAAQVSHFAAADKLLRALCAKHGVWTPIMTPDTQTYENLQAPPFFTCYREFVWCDTPVMPGDDAAVAKVEARLVELVARCSEKKECKRKYFERLHAEVLTAATTAEAEFDGDRNVWKPVDADETSAVMLGVIEGELPECFRDVLQWWKPIPVDPPEAMAKFDESMESLAKYLVAIRTGLEARLGDAAERTCSMIRLLHECSSANDGSDELAASLHRVENLCDNDANRALELRAGKWVNDKTLTRLVRPSTRILKMRDSSGAFGMVQRNAIPFPLTSQIVSMISRCTSLEELHLHGMNRTSLDPVLDAVPVGHFRSLRLLNLSETYKISTRGLGRLVEIGLAALRALRLDSLDLSPIGLQTLLSATTNLESCPHLDSALVICP